jgi:hypothetical protein
VTQDEHDVIKHQEGLGRTTRVNGLKLFVNDFLFKVFNYEKVIDQSPFMMPASHKRSQEGQLKIVS